MTGPPTRRGGAGGGVRWPRTPPRPARRYTTSRPAPRVGTTAMSASATAARKMREVRAAPSDFHRLHTSKPDRAHHQQRRDEDQCQGRQRRPPLLQPARIQVDRRDDHRRRGGGWETREVTLVGGGIRLNIETCEPHCRRGDIQKPDRPPQSLQWPQAPRKREDGRRQAERHDVGEGVELDAKSGRGVRQACDEAVQSVEIIATPIRSAAVSKSARIA